MQHKLTDTAQTNNAVPCDCETDPIECIKQMFVDMVQLGRIKQGQDPARRPVFLRLHGVAHGTFEVVAGLPEALRVGVFAEQRIFPIWARFSSDLRDGLPDLKSTVGISFKLFGVDGAKVLSPDEDSTTADFLFQNMNIFFANDAHDMCAFTKSAFEGTSDAWLKDHPRTAEILNDMKKEVESVLTTPYWSVIPFRLGETFCKYKLVPELAPDGSEPNYNDPNYLRVDLEERFKKGEVRFKFMVQPYLDEKLTPLDEATVPWNETASEPIHVATLTFHAQDITARGQSNYGESLSFNPWRTLLVHEPVGSIAEARKVAYHASATLRRNVNGEPIGEPTELRPATPWPTGKDTTIVRAAIHPAIGIARIGNSTEEFGWYIGPEVTQPLHPVMRDESGAIKRQAARFRIYGYNAADELVSEITADDAYIEWTVHLANKKAQWYRFVTAMDIPETVDLSVPQRNPDLKGAARKVLAIDPGPRCIDGKNTFGEAYQFNSGEFMGTPVPLGEIRTDPQGRLLVLGGLGQSASPQDKPIYQPSDPDSFNNADGWFDDISDGSVKAKVSFGGVEIPVEPAWVAVAPPNYAPEVISWNTMYDLLIDTYTNAGWMSLPETISFNNDVLPILSRLSNLQWVNKGFAATFGKDGPMNFENPELLTKLSYKPEHDHQPDTYAELRLNIFNAFRPADANFNDVRIWPWVYGDAFDNSPTSVSPRNNLSMLKTRAYILHQWAMGNFVNDWTPDAPVPHTIEDVPLEQQPAMLDQAALHFCLADAFHPGCEITWPMRHLTMYSAPFRIRQRAEDDPEPDYGTNLTQQIALQTGGPLYAQAPGDLSRWMALPWQGDTAFCRAGYDPQYDPYLPTFWPARVPNQILTEEDYNIVMNESLPREERLAAFNNREAWLRNLLTGSPSAPEVMLRMIANFGSMGILATRPGIKNDPDFPEVMLVESLSRQLRLLRAAAPAMKTRPKTHLEKGGWGSQEQLEEFRRARFGRS